MIIDQDAVQELQTKMLERRKEILDLRDSLQSSWKNLQERENEIEEMASKETLVEGLEALDNQVIEELEKIDTALAGIDSGTYGRCEMCDRPIAAKRLRAIPWATVCKICAQNREMPPSGEEPEDEDQAQESLSDAQIVESIWDELDTKDTLKVDHLEIRCDNGTVFLTGRLSTEQEHQLVLETIEEDLGFEDFIDRIDIGEPERPSYDKDEQTYEKETTMQGQPPQDDPYTAMEDNESMVPPDRMLPEDER